MKSNYSVLDMFAGAGGLSEGFFRQNFDIIAHVEKDKYAAQTLETRLLFHELKKHKREEIYHQYMMNKHDENARQYFVQECKLHLSCNNRVINKEISVDTEDIIIEKINSYLKESYHEGIDIIIGGPPCQAYSVMGRSRDSNRMIDDPRNELYIHYLKFLEEYKPKIFVFENVPGIKTARKGQVYSDFQEKVQKLGYDIETDILNALDFGVLQIRKRVIIIGWKKSYKLTYPSFENNISSHKVWDLLEDLPKIEPGEGTRGPQEYRKKTTEYLQESGIRIKENILLDHEARKHNERDREIYRRAIAEWNENRKRLRYNKLPPYLKTHKNKTSFLDRFKVVDGDGYSHSIVAHLSKDGHHFIHPDINQSRSLTVREAARIQSFPDNYIFEGPRTAQYIQIGNAVPPMMAEGIAIKIRKMLDEIR